MKSKKRITVLLGSGATIEAAGISTQSITKSVIEKQQLIYNFKTHQEDKYPLLKFIYDSLCSYYGKESDSVSFEDIFHTIEMLDAFKTAQKGNAVKSYRSVFGMLGQLKKEFEEIDDLILYTAMNDLINVVINCVGSAEESWKCPENGWFVDFFKELDSTVALDLFTLNYDTWLNQILENANDGFIPFIDQYKRFSVNELFGNCNTSTVNFLHGNICLTGHLPEEYRREHRFNEFFKVDNFNVIKNYPGYPQIYGTKIPTQSSEAIYSYPIITGLRKTDKIFIPPFDSYLAHFHQCLLQNSSLLVIGYGFNDLYINFLLNQFRDYHQENGNVIFITYLSPYEPFIDFFDMGISPNFKQTIYRTFNEPRLDTRFLGIERLDHVDSKDGRNQVYFCGFSETVQKYKNDIIRFFL